MFFLKSLWMTILAAILILLITWCMEDALIRNPAPISIPYDMSKDGHV